MFPSKMFETGEMNRLLSQSIENDGVPHYSLFQSPVANRSSSSAESVSPESYFSVPFQFNQDSRTRSILSPSPSKIHSYQDFFESSPNSDSSQFQRRHDLRSPQIYESLRSYRAPQIYDSPRSCYDFVNIDPSLQPRPIVGRKILGGTSQVKARERIDSSTLDFWHDNITPPNSHPKSYELFPRPEEFETFRTPIRSPSISNINTRPSSTISNYTNTRSYNSNYGHFKNQRMDSHIGEGKICTFCRKNGETPMVYSDHRVKEKVDGRFIVTCPILRSHRCETCGLSGDDAHTITYCPVLRSNNNGRPLTSTTIKLKNTKLKSNGKPRY